MTVHHTWMLAVGGFLMVLAVYTASGRANLGRGRWAASRPLTVTLLIGLSVASMSASLASPRPAWVAAAGIAGLVATVASIAIFLVRAFTSSASEWDTK